MCLFLTDEVRRSLLLARLLLHLRLEHDLRYLVLDTMDLDLVLDSHLTIRHRLLRNPFRQILLGGSNDPLPIPSLVICSRLKSSSRFATILITSWWYQKRTTTTFLPPSKEIGERENSLTKEYHSSLRLSSMLLAGLQKGYERCFAETLRCPPDNPAIDIASCAVARKVSFTEAIPYVILPGIVNAVVFDHMPQHQPCIIHALRIGYQRRFEHMGCIVEYSLMAELTDPIAMRFVIEGVRLPSNSPCAWNL